MPDGYVHSKAIVDLIGLGIEHQGESKLTDVYRDEEFDLFVSECSGADEDCPVWLWKEK